MFTGLMIAAGLLWSLAYLLVIRRGFLDRTYGMPLVALCANLSWEFMFSFVYAHDAPQRWVNTAWFCLDLVIAYQLLRYGPREFSELRRGAFYGAFALALATSFCAVFFVSHEFDGMDGVYSAFGQNLLMSVLFVTMLHGRGSLRGQSAGIAVAKMSGTALASLAFFFYSTQYAGSPLLAFLFVSILVYDAIYVALVVLRGRALRAAPA